MSGGAVKSRITVSRWDDPEYIWLGQLHQQWFSRGHRYVGDISGKFLSILCSDREQLHSTYVTIRRKLDTEHPGALTVYQLACMGLQQEQIADVMGLNDRKVRTLLQACEDNGLPSWRLTKETRGTDQRLTNDERRVAGLIWRGFNLAETGMLLDWPEARCRALLRSATRKEGYADIVFQKPYGDPPPKPPKREAAELPVEG